MRESAGGFRTGRKLKGGRNRVKRKRKAGKGKVELTKVARSGLLAVPPTLNKLLLFSPESDLFGDDGTEVPAPLEVVL